jgi:hypothetical protein
MGGLFGGAAPAAPEPPPPPPDRGDADVQLAARKERLRQSKSQGRASTILTSGQGVTDEATPVKKTLLGSA